jgi:CBS-domain-containing membrane protein
MAMKRVLVADVMVVDFARVSRDATLDEADGIIRSTFVTGVPVIDADGVLVGVIGHAQMAAHRFARPSDSSDGSPATTASAR